MQRPDQHLLAMSVVEQRVSIKDAKIVRAGHGVAADFQLGGLQGPLAMMNTGTIEAAAKDGVEAVTLSQPVRDGAGRGREDGTDRSVVSREVRL